MYGKCLRCGTLTVLNAGSTTDLALSDHTAKYISRMVIGGVVPLCCSSVFWWTSYLSMFCQIYSLWLQQRERENHTCGEKLVWFHPQRIIVFGPDMLLC